MAIATRTSRGEGSETPIQIRAQFLRDRPIEAPAGPLSGFAVIPDADALQPVDAAVRGKSGWRQSDAERAIKSAEGAGLANYRIEIAPDGTISIVVGMP